MGAGKRITEDIRKKRFGEINKRLNKLTEEDVRRFLYSSGYFPENQYLPSDFFNTSNLVEANNFKRLGTINKSLSIFEDPSLIFFPKNKFTLRTLGIPPLVNYVILSNFISTHWNDIKKHLSFGRDDLIVPYSYPLFYEDANRSGIGIENYRIFSELDIPRAAALYSHCVVLDIKNFYPSVYTHSLAWALDPKTVHRNNCGCRGRTKCVDHSGTYWPNEFDTLVRKLDRNRTKGLLIGPLTSDIASEILLRTIDRKISKAIVRGKYSAAGFRFKDDYYLFTDSLKEAGRLMKDTQVILNEFHLDVNEQKTKILSSDDFEDKKAWKVEVDALKTEIEQSFKGVDKKGNIALKEKELRHWFKKTGTLYKQYEDPYILKSILGSLIDRNVHSVSLKKTTTNVRPYNVQLDVVYGSLFAMLFQLCRKEPSTWPQFIAFLCLCFEGGKPKIRESINSLLNDYADSFIDSDDSFSLIWTLYAMWRCKLKINIDAKCRVRKNYKGNWVIQSLLEKKYGQVEIDGQHYNLINAIQRQRKPLHQVLSVFSYGSKFKA